MKSNNMQQSTELSTSKPNPGSFDFRPVLKGTHVEVRPLHARDHKALCNVASDPLVWQQHPSSRNEKAEFDRFFKDSLASNGALLVIDTVTKSVIGSSRYHGYDKQNSSIEIGWTFLARSHWGGKYNGDLKRVMLNHAFNYIDTVIFYIDLNNKRSQKSVEKFGAVRDNALDNKGRVIYQLRKSTYYN